MEQPPSDQDGPARLLDGASVGDESRAKRVAVVDTLTQALRAAVAAGDDELAEMLGERLRRAVANPAAAGVIRLDDARERRNGNGNGGKPT